MSVEIERRLRTFDDGNGVRKPLAILAANELRANRLRLDALSRDWHKHRDIEKEWRVFTQRVVLVAAFVGAVSAVSILMGWL